MKYLLLLLTAATTLLAFSPGSFRLQSTAGVWEDDYDLIFDPGRLPLIDGARVYTGLSNYVTSNEAVFGLNSSNFILAGASGHLRDKFAPAVLADGHSYRLPQYTYLQDQAGDSLFGSGRVIDVFWQDQDSNGVYDYKQVRAVERNAWTAGSGSDLLISAGYLSGPSRFGISLSWEDSTRRQVMPGGNYIINDYDSSLVAGRIVYRLDDTGHYVTRYRQSAGALVLSGWFGLKDGSQLGLSLGPRLLLDDSGLDNTMGRRVDYNPGGSPVVGFLRQIGNSSQSLAYQGVQVPLNATLTRSGEKSESWLYVGGFYQAEKPSGAAGSHAYYSSQRTQYPGDYFIFDTTTHNYRGLRSSFGGSVRFKELYRMGERLNLGWSAQLGARGYADSLLDDMQEHGGGRYDDGDSVQTHADYTQVTSGAERWLDREAGYEGWLTLPVGLEFKLVPSVAFRLGAQHTVTLSDRTKTGQLISWSPHKTRTVYGDGSFFEEVDSLGRRTASSEHTFGFDQQTLFSYGAGFRPLDNLQIDLMGFANLVNLTGWRLSATLRF